MSNHIPNKAKHLLLEFVLDGRGEDNPRKTVWSNGDALDAMKKHTIEFGEWMAKYTIPAGGYKFYHKEYLTKGIKYKKPYNIKQLYNKFNSGK